MEEQVYSKIESVGSEPTGVPGQVERVRLALAGVSGEIIGATVANPEGYRADHALTMGLARLNLGVIASLT